MAEHFSVINSSFLEDQSAPVLASEASNTITESVADTVSRVMDGLRQSLGEGCSSSTSSDSLSLVVSPHIAGIIKHYQSECVIGAWLCRWGVL